MVVERLVPRYEYVDRHFWVGFPPELLIRNAELIRKFIDRHQLEPIEETAAGAGLGLAAPRVAKAAARKAGDAAFAAESIDARMGLLEELVLRRRGFPGGWPVDHLHFDDRVFLLTKEQWKEFTGEMLGVYQERLAKAEHVTFDQLRSISAAIDGLSG